MEKKEILFYRETIWQSIVSDIITFSFVFGFALLNRFILGDHWYYALFFIFMFFVMIASRKDNFKRFKTKEELQNYIDKNL